MTDRRQARGGILFIFLNHTEGTKTWSCLLSSAWGGGGVAQPCTPNRARPRLLGPASLGWVAGRVGARRGRLGATHTSRLRTPAALEPAPNLSAVLLPGAPRPPSGAAPRARFTSQARAVVSGPDLSDFHRAPAQGGQDQALAQEVAARVAERVRRARHVRQADRAAPPPGKRELGVRARARVSHDPRAVAATAVVVFF